MLVSTDELAAHLDDPTWVVFDCRHDLMDATKGERLYREGHLPRAHFASVDHDLSSEKNGTNGRHPLPSPAAIAAFLARHGVNESSIVIAYDDAGGQFAARLWWLARWIGIEQVGLLDGGSAKWVAEGRALTPEMVQPTPAALRARPNATQLWNAADVLAHLNDPDCCLIDARAPERYRGEVEPIDPVAGHIPGAHNFFNKNNLNADLTFKPKADIKAAFSALISGRTNVVHQCGSGVTACLNIFAMEYAGLAGSKLYAGSWSEWIADPNRPIVTKD
jgi:thiosulfate/3-mercaptopyruvate sulfurtransferase